MQWNNDEKHLDLLVRQKWLEELPARPDEANDTKHGHASHGVEHKKRHCPAPRVAHNVLKVEIERLKRDSQHLEQHHARHEMVDQEHRGRPTQHPKCPHDRQRHVHGSHDHVQLAQWQRAHRQEVVPDTLLGNLELERHRN